MLGGGLVSLITSAILKDYVSEIGVFTEGNVLPFKQFGVEIISNLDKSGIILLFQLLDHGHAWLHLDF